MKNNKGFSLVEMIIAIAIVAVLSGASIVSIGVLRNNDIKKTNNYVNTILGNTKTYCMSKKTASCTFYQTADGIRCKMKVNGEEISDELIGGDQVTMKYRVASSKGTYAVTDAATQTLGALNSGDELEISFDRSSGALVPHHISTPNKYYVYEIYLVKGSKLYTYQFVPLTGKFTVK